MRTTSPESMYTGVDRPSEIPDTDHESLPPCSPTCSIPMDTKYERIKDWFFRAILEGDPKLVKSLICENSSLADCFHHSSQPQSAVSFALYCGRPDIVRLLAPWSVLLNGSTENDPGAPLLCAAIERHKVLIDALLAVGTDPLMAGVTAQTRIFQAAILGNLQAIEVLLAGGQVDGTEVNSHGDMPFVVAILTKNSAAARLLLPSTDKQCEASKSQLQKGLRYALELRDGDSVKALLGRGDDLAKTISVSEFCAAAQWGHSCVISILQTVDMPTRVLREALCKASVVGGREAVKALLPRVTPAWEDIYGPSPLYYAAKYGHLGCVRILLHRGFDPVSKSFCPTEASKDSKRERILALLVSGARRTQPKRRGGKGKTAKGVITGERRSRRITNAKEH